MRFKDFASFAVMMFGKHGQKFQTDPTSLVTRLFKACYFPNSDFTGSMLGSNLSYVWKSIFTTKMVVKKGARWRIGTSANIPLFGALCLTNGMAIADDNPILAY